MPLTLRWEVIALRLALPVTAGSLTGLNRSEGGHAAGLRTTLPVCLAASVAVIQTDLLLAMGRKEAVGAFTETAYGKRLTSGCP
jgi:putative Mg2+ transporter-C (MgtC) family protein